MICHRLQGLDNLNNANNYIFKVIASRFEKETLWLCTGNGLIKAKYVFDNPGKLDTKFWGSDKNVPNSLSHPTVPDMLEEDEHRVWVATLDGLNFLNTQTGENQVLVSQKNDPHSLSNNMIRSIQKDRSGNLWIGMHHGINKLNLDAKAFHHLKLNSPENINSVACLVESKTKNGVWVGSRGGGLNFFQFGPKGKFGSEPQHYAFALSEWDEFSTFILDIILDDQQNLWIATDGAGIFRVAEKKIPDTSSTISDFEHFYIGNKLRENYITSLLKSSSGDIWIGYWDKGFDRFDPKTGVFHSYLFSKDLAINFENFPIVHLVETIENNEPYLWAGTRGGGVFKLKLEEATDQLVLVQQFQNNTSTIGELSNNNTNAFLLDSKKRLWIGTDNGLNLLDRKTNKFKVFHEKHGLRNAIIQSILEDEVGNIWLSTQKGISLLDYSKERLKVKNFDSYDGLQDGFFNDDASLVSPSGHLVFGGVNGLSFFFPSKIQYDTTTPKIVITDLKLLNQSIPIGELEDGRTVLSKSISETESLMLSHRDNILALEFKGLHFDEPKKIQYAYKLEGFNSDWIYTDASQRIATYTNLPYRNFVFKVKAANRDGVWSKPIELKLNIKPPFRQSGWAYMLYAMALGGLIYLGIRFTKLRAEDKHKLQLERLEKDKLQEVNQLKLQFFTNLSHELRTPLTLIISPLVQLLQEPNDSKNHQLFTRMYYNANRLLIMINQLLDIRKNEAGLMNLRVTEGDIVGFGREITLSFNNLAEQRGIDLKFSSRNKQIITWFDYEQMEKVLFNLLSNAFKFTKDGGRIEVCIEQKHGVEILVTDTGVGIPFAQLENIFERFYQVENKAEWSRKSGTGIGLSLAKMIVEKHHGDISVVSKEGFGTTFRIYIPMGNTHFSEKEIVDEAYYDNSIEREIIQTSNTKTEETFQNDKAQKSTLLIVEDNQDIRSYLRENLGSTYHISEASDGQEGLEKALAEPPALIIADIAMPRMNGIELCAKIKSTLETSHIPVILLTARTSMVFKVDGLETGADDYITKPFNMHLLAVRINNLIESRKRLHERFSKSFDFSPSEITINSLDEELLAQVKTVIEKHIDDSSFSVAKLAKILHMTRLQLYRKLTALTGQSPTQIIRKFRLKRAAQLLESGNYNVSDVTYMVGYNDLKSFRQQFKKEFGVSPSGYTRE